MSNINADAAFADVDAVLKQGLARLGDKCPADAFACFGSAIGLLAESAKTDVNAADRLADAQEFASRAAYQMAHLTGGEEGVDWFDRSLAAHESSVNLREKIFREGRKDGQDCGYIVAAFHTLVLRCMEARKFEKAIEVASRSRAFQEENKDIGVLPLFYLSAFGNHAISLLQLKRPSEALEVVNQGLYSMDPENLSDRDGLKTFSDLCSIKSTILGAIEKKKLH